MSDIVIVISFFVFIYGVLKGLKWLFKKVDKAEKLPQLKRAAIYTIGGFCFYIALATIYPKDKTAPPPAQSVPQTISQSPTPKVEQKEEAVKSTAKDNKDTLVSFIKGKIPTATEVKLTSQFDDDKTYLADININKDPFTGGKNDWNVIAGEVFHYCKELFKNDSIVRVHFAFCSPENKNIDWAHVRVNRKEITDTWKDDTYLQFFSRLKPDAGTPQSTQWLCDFYKKYESSRLNGKIPDYCSMYSK